LRICEICGARFRGNPETCPLDGGSLVDLPDPLLGRTVAGRFVIAERIGAGGMGVVYRARHEVVGRDVAIKFLSPDLAYEPANRTRFLREARAANRINHEHIIDITDFGETDDGLVYLVMEFLDGTPLNEAVARGPIPLERTMRIGLQIAQAMARAHELHVVHRDLKPDNIYLLEGYQGDFVKILDFGLAHMRGELRVTATGAVFGTPEYISPEQARGAPIGPGADLYSLGVVLFEMLTGQLPFQGSTPDLILKHLREPPRAPSFHEPTLPTEVDAMVLRLLEKDPADRHSSAYELAAEIQDWLEANRTSATSVSPAPAKASAPPAHEEGEPTQETLTGSQLVDRWRQRVKVLRGLVPRAHPSGDAPEWLTSALAGIAEEVDALDVLRHDLTSRVTVASSQQEEARNAQMRIGHALDQLASDATRIGRELAMAREKLDEARARIAQIGDALTEAWAAIPPWTQGAEAEPPVLAALSEAGALATIRLEAERTIDQESGRVQTLEREHTDLRFQMDQLKGRLGGLSAASEVDLEDLRAEARNLDRRLQDRLDAIVQKTSPVVKHFMGFSHLRDEVRAAHGG
jgi:serine/threonine protein kinase/predicted  nucleic acid-binding Zn-ribbon protein